MHVLDWTEQPTFAVDLLRLVQPVRCTVDANARWMPQGHAHPAEARLETFGPQAFPDKPTSIWQALHDWWLVNGGNTPNWDIALRANIEGEPGLILVEAKANVPELDNGPKAQRKDRSPGSEANDRRIRQALEEAHTALEAEVPGVKLSCDADYQLSNRIAFTWKLASLGTPTVLVYLGFTGDKGMDASGRAMFRDADAWTSAFTSHLQTAAQPSILERRIPTTGAAMWMLARSKPVLRDSPPASDAVAGATNTSAGAQTQ